jgi:hypothetical protein
LSIVSGLKTLQEIIETDYPPTPSVVESLLDPGEVALFIARQKEGKSMLACQLGIDVACGDKFLGQYQTIRRRVLYVDYENRFQRIKERGIELAEGRDVSWILFKAYERMSDRDVGLFRDEYRNLQACVRDSEADLLIIDPLRYALANNNQGGTTEEKLIINAIDQIAQLREANDSLATILVHHIKKRQDFSRQTVKLKDDPRSWIEQCYGSQALTAHVDTIVGLEQDGGGYTFATVPRSHGPMILHLEKEDSPRFVLASSDTFAFKTKEQSDAWASLPEVFRWRQVAGKKPLLSNNIFQAVKEQALAWGILVQDPKTKEFRKVNRIIHDANTGA